MNTATEFELEPRIANNDTDGGPARDPRPLGEIANDIWQKAETLIRQELQLGITDAQERLETMRGEVETRADQLKVEVTAKAIGGAVMFVGLLAIAAAVILLLSEAIDPWISALIVGAVMGGIGFALLKKPTKALQPVNTRQLLPKRALESTKKDIKAIEEAVK